MDKLIFSLLSMLLLSTSFASEKEVNEAELEIKSSTHTKKERVWCLVYFQENEQELFLIEGRPLKLTKEGEKEFLLLRGKVLGSENEDVWPFKILSSACSSDYSFATKELSEATSRQENEEGDVSDELSPDKDDTNLTANTNRPNEAPSNYSEKEREISLISKKSDKETKIALVEVAKEEEKTETLISKENEATPLKFSEVMDKQREIISKRNEHLPRKTSSSNLKKPKEKKTKIAKNNISNNQKKEGDSKHKGLDPSSIGENYEKRKGSFFRLSK